MSRTRAATGRNCFKLNDQFLNETAIGKLVDTVHDKSRGISLVSKPRRDATALLTQAALMLNAGDIVETGN